jgi:hypothetical protein
MGMKRWTPFGLQTAIPYGPYGIVKIHIIVHDFGIQYIGFLYVIPYGVGLISYLYCSCRWLVAGGFPPRFHFKLKSNLNSIIL